MITEELINLIAEKLLFSSFIIIALYFIILDVFVNKAMKTIRKDYEALWIELGSPSIFNMTNLPFKFLRFCYKPDKYQHFSLLLSNKKIILYIKIARITTSITIITLTTTILYLTIIETFYF